jgi:hypothetical protein
VNLFQIAAAHGGRALLQVLMLALVFLALNLLRTMLHRLVCGLTALMRGLDRAALARLAATAPRPTNDQFRPAWGRSA